MKVGENVKSSVREFLVDINTFEDSKSLEITIDNPFDEIQCDGPISIELFLYKEKDSLIVSGKVSATVIEQCSRCLKPVKLPIDGVVEAIYVSHSKFFKETKKGPVEELENTFPLTEEILDLSDRIIEAIIVEIPQKVLCSESCRGLCPECGADLNENPQHSCEIPEKPQDKWHSLLYNLKESLNKENQ
ncbi:YceD family protein [Kosmotoga pacifica]|uniref:YceD family protein n=1 Tax=Kosmotoga pacifica TaxID=1330330 RepID=UPI002354B1B0|nr:DUF177 domain-containing protein [Kosmotoga pacifica]